MTVRLPLPAAKKLTIIYNVESGCLGPRGRSHIEAFCQFAQEQMADLHSDFINWQITPRTDNSKPEIQYSLMNKLLQEHQTDKFLSYFNKSVDELETFLLGIIVILIEQYHNEHPETN